MTESNSGSALLVSQELRLGELHEIEGYDNLRSFLKRQLFVIKLCLSYLERVVSSADYNGKVILTAQPFCFLFRFLL